MDKDSIGSDLRKPNTLAGMVKEKILKILKIQVPNAQMSDIVFNDKRFFGSRGHYTFNIMKLAQKKKDKKTEA